MKFKKEEQKDVGRSQENNGFFSECEGMKGSEIGV